MMISERIFELIKERGITQKEFALRTGIARSSISDWKRKKTNLAAEKILVICEALNVTPYELLGGTDGQGRRSTRADIIVLNRASEEGQIAIEYMSMKKDNRERLLGYMNALREMEKMKT